MVSFIQHHEALIRLSVFLGVFATMALLEVVFPKKQLAVGRGRRWLTNWGLVIVNSVTVRFLTPVLAVTWATTVAGNDWGVLNWLGLPFWLEVIIGVVVLDMLIYWQHVASHHFPLLWRMHKIHHADRDIDVTTGARFHPLEIVLSMFYKLLCIALLGPAAMAVFLFEVILNASAMFNHSNVRLTPLMDSYMRAFIVTPDMHRVHHSVRINETNSNYGFFLSLWDKLFGSYIAQPADGHESMQIGLKEYQNDQPTSLWWSLQEPFRNPNKGQPDVD